MNPEWPLLRKKPTSPLLLQSRYFETYLNHQITGIYHANLEAHLLLLVHCEVQLARQCHQYRGLSMKKAKLRDDERHVRIDFTEGYLEYSTASRQEHEPKVASKLRVTLFISTIQCEANLAMTMWWSFLAVGRPATATEKEGTGEK